MRVVIRIRKALRIRRILTIFATTGFGYLIDRFRVCKFKPITKTNKVVIHKSQGERMRLAIEQLGPVFIKFGQIISTRVDLLPRALIKELSKLQDAVPPIRFEVINQVIEEEIGAPAEKIFDVFDKTPIASASLAQVYKAQINGEKVVVKVQRPDIRKVIETDIQILKDVAKILERRIPETRIYDPITLVEEFERVIISELNFVQEAMNIERFRKNFGEDKDIWLPKVYWEFTTPRILTLSRIEGIKINEFKALQEAGLSLEGIAKKGAKIILKQIFEHGFFHGDPHPGNIFVTKEGKIALVDFGIVGRIDDETRKLLATIFTAFINKETDEIIDKLEEIGVVKLENKEEFRRDIYELLDRYHDIPIGKIEVRTASDDGFRVLRKYKVRMPRNLVLLTKALVEIEGIAKEMAPQFNIIEFAKPWTRKIIIEYGRKWGSDILKPYIRILKEAPIISIEILKKLSKGEIRVKLEHSELETSIKKIERTVKKIVYIVGILITIILGIILWIITKK